jgi:ribosomal protein uS19
MNKLRAAHEEVAGQPGSRPKMVKTHLRAMVVFPEFVDNVITIFNGKEFVDVQISPEMIGDVLAEFAPSKKLVRHSKADVGATRNSSAISLK